MKIAGLDSDLGWYVLPLEDLQTISEIHTRYRRERGVTLDRALTAAPSERRADIAASLLELEATIGIEQHEIATMMWRIATAAYQAGRREGLPPEVTPTPTVETDGSANELPESVDLSEFDFSGVKH